MDVAAISLNGEGAESPCTPLGVTLLQLALGTPKGRAVNEQRLENTIMKLVDRAAASRPATRVRVELVDRALFVPPPG